MSRSILARKPLRPVRVVAVLALVATGLTLQIASTTTAAPARAADTSQFQAGNIISDQVFYDSATMSPASIQSFLASKGGALQSYRASSSSRAADGLCNAYQGGTNELASTIIAKVAQACGINPRVLLVTLQKEQGLITDTSPSSSAYRIAMGYGCPDTAACDSLYFGFANQLYSAAHQFKRYAAYPSNYPYHAGMTNNILWNPNTACGRSAVYLVNQATTSLYNYTPYRPNAAALRAGYGKGDSCSSYGNRNFWEYFTDWFGSTQYSGPAAILAAYTAAGSNTGPLGAATTGYVCGIRNGGCFQHFTNGSIYWSSTSGAHTISADLYSGWAALGWENSPLGYPTDDGSCGLTGGGCFQHFQGGSLYWQSSVGAHYVQGPILDKWKTLSYEVGSLGYPTGNPLCILKDHGCYQNFQGGAIYYSPDSDAHVVSGDLRDRWAQLQWETGMMGYPTSDPACGLPDTGCSQQFQGGMLIGSASTGYRVVRNSILAAYRKTGFQDGFLGYPTTDVLCGYTEGGCLQKYQAGGTGGSIYSSPATGAHPITGEIYARWAALRWETGILGYPASDPACGLPDTGCSQQFQGGMLIGSASTGYRVVRNSILAAYRKTGFQDGFLGYPTTDVLCGYTGGGCLQKYQAGSIYSSPTTGAHPITGDIYAKWASMRWEQGPLGYPTSDIATVPGGFFQRFEHGTLQSNTATHAVTVTFSR